MNNLPRWLKTLSALAFIFLISNVASASTELVFTGTPTVTATV